jgi:CHASE3 domain sensor protein
MHRIHKHPNIRLDQIKLRSEFQIRKLNKNIDGLLLNLENIAKYESDLDNAHKEIKKLKSERDYKASELVISHFKQDSRSETIKIITEFIKAEKNRHRNSVKEID